ncbi:MAG TPA: MFS transporter [Streptosporangiaceae bacterium]
MTATVENLTEAGSERAFWTYWGASTASGVGSGVTGVALPLTAVLLLHASTFEMGLLAAASYVAWLVVGLPAGAIVLRLPLRATQLRLDLVRAAAIATIPIAWWAGVLTLWQLVAVALAISFADVFFDVANSTFLPRVVPKAKLHERNSLMSGTNAATQLGGPSLGGVLVQTLGAASAMYVDAVSYVVSAVFLRTLPESTESTASAVSAPTGGSPLRRQIREGWDFVTRHPVMNACMWDATAINFVCGGQMALFAVYLVRDAGAPAEVVGFLLASDGVGSLIGAALSPRVVRALGSARACVIAGLVAVAGALLIPFGHHALACVMFVIGNIVFAAGVVIGSTATRTFRQTATPPELLSRVMATVRFVSWGAIPFGGLAAGVLGGWIGVRETLFVFGALAALSPLVLVLSPVRRMRDLA